MKDASIHIGGRPAGSCEACFEHGSARKLSRSAQSHLCGPLLLLLLWTAASLHAAPADPFVEGLNLFRAGNYSAAATLFRQAAQSRPGSGTLQNLGLAEWHCGRVGTAILAWEQAGWLDPLNRAVHANLRFARKTAQLESPELAWYEVVSTWLPVNWWTWIAGLSLWSAVSILVLPGIFRLRKAPWHQAAAAFGLALFLLSVPAQIGVHTRSRLGFVLQKDTPLRLTPTAEAQFITRLAAGDPARLERLSGPYCLIRTNHARGWVEREEFGLMCPRVPPTLRTTRR